MSVNLFKNGTLTKIAMGLKDVAATATKLATARTIDGVNFDGSAAISHYGTCSTAAATAAKAVALTGFKLITGAHIKVKFTVTNTASNPTLNVNSTGAKAIYYRGSAISAGYLAKNRTYEFVYNGTQWELVGDIDTNTTYSTMTGATASAAGKSGLVPAPAAGANRKFLRGDGTWQNAPAAVTPVNNLLATVAGSPLDAVQGKVLDDKITKVNNSLTNESAETFNFGILNGKRGFFTDSSRGADSFYPFSSKDTLTPTVLKYFQTNTAWSYTITEDCYVQIISPIQASGSYAYWGKITINDIEIDKYNSVNTGASWGGGYSNVYRCKSGDIIKSAIVNSNFKYDASLIQWN